jgi:hypothetical protein
MANHGLTNDLNNIGYKYLADNIIVDEKELNIHYGFLTKPKTELVEFNTKTQEF